MSSSSDVPSRFSHLGTSEKAVRLRIALPVSPELRQYLLESLTSARAGTREALEQSAKTNGGGQSKVEDQVSILDLLFVVVEAMVHSGRLDLALTYHQQAPNHYTLCTAAHVGEQAEVLESKFRRLARSKAFENAGVGEVALDVAHRPGWTIHVLKPPPGLLSFLSFGYRPNLHVAFGQGAVALFRGDDSLTGIEQLIDRIDAPNTSVRSAPPLDLRIAWGKLLPPPGTKAPTAEMARELALARKSFASDDRLHLTLGNIENGVRLRLELQEGFLRYFGQAAAIGFQAGLEQVKFSGALNK